MARETSLFSGIHLEAMRSNICLAFIETEELHDVQTNLILTRNRLCDERAVAASTLCVIETGLCVCTYSCVMGSLRKHFNDRNDPTFISRLLHICFAFVS